MTRSTKSSRLLALLVAALPLFAATCSDDAEHAPPTDAPTTQPDGTPPAGDAATDAAASDGLAPVELPSVAKPLVVDQARAEVRVYTEVNGKTFTESTRHGIVFKGGSNGDKPVLIAHADQLDFHDALIAIGAKPGNNVKLDSPPGTQVAGDVLRVTMSWGAVHEDFAAGIKQVPPDKGLEVRFGGNREASASKQTGCVLCLDTCAVGITSNANWGWQSWTNGDVKFFGNDAVLPAAGTPVVVTFARVQ